MNVEILQYCELAYTKRMYSFVYIISFPNSGDCRARLFDMKLILSRRQSSQNEFGLWQISKVEVVDGSAC